MKKTHKLLILLALVCTLVVCGMMTANAKLDVQESYYYDTVTGVLTIKKMNLDSYPLGVATTPWYTYRNSIQEVVFADTVTEISRHAFKNMSVKEVVVGKNITTIGKNAFQDSSLETITFSDSVTLIEESAFDGCNLKNVTFNEGLKTIEKKAFNEIETLQSVKFPSTLTSIGEKAFHNCDVLKSVEFGEGSGLTIGTSAFEYCRKLADVNFGYGLTSVGTRAFFSCYALKTINLPDTTKTISAAAFAYTNATIAYLGANVSSVENNAFSNCNYLKTITYGTKYTAAGTVDYENYPNITTLYFLGTEEELEATGSKNLYSPDNIYYSHEHTYTDTVVIEQTCVDYGKLSRLCFCGHRCSAPIDPDGVHDYNIIIEHRVPNCLDWGYLHAKCYCGAETKGSLKRDYNNHIGNTTTVNQVEATCHSDGYTGDTYCDMCKRTSITGSVIPATGDHKYVKDSVTTEPTCTATGIELQKCSNEGCSATRNQTIPATGHSFTTKVTNRCVAATCNAKGLDVYQCHCGETKETELPINKYNHTGGVEYRNGYAENCGDPGYQGDIYCLGCGSYRGRGMTINPTGNHGSIYIQGDYKENCGNDGYTGNKYCSVCKNLIESGEKIPATGKHNDSNHDGVCNTCGKDSTVSCNHMCHKGGFWYKFCLFFWKLFKMNKTCSCGMYHY